MSAGARRSSASFEVDPPAGGAVAACPPPVAALLLADASAQALLLDASVEALGEAIDERRLPLEHACLPSVAQLLAIGTDEPRAAGDAGDDPAVRAPDTLMLRSTLPALLAALAGDPPPLDV